MYIWICLFCVLLIACVVLTWLYIRTIKRSKGKDKIITSIVMIIFLVINLFCGFMIVRKIANYKQCSNAYNQLAEILEESLISNDEVAEESDSNEETSTSQKLNFDVLKEKAPDIAAWITIPNTVINYPVTHTDNNEYYLNHLYDGTYNQSGCPFIDYRNRPDFSDRNTII